MIKKFALWLVVILALSIGIIVVWNSYNTEFDEGVLYDTSIYTFDPKVILTSLDQGDVDLFKVSPSDSEANSPLLWPPATFSWNQEEYLKVADALHEFVWKEPLEDWHLIRAYFRILQCQDVSKAIDYVALSFYQRQGDSYVVHGMRIDPLHGTLIAGTNSYYYSGKWVDIDLAHISVNEPYVALGMAESSGGREARSSAKNKCHVDIYFAPYVTEYNIITHPVNRFGWGWNVLYEDDGLNSIFEMIIDPYTAKYAIKNAN
jgi:hypothetical protein